MTTVAPAFTESPMPSVHQIVKVHGLAFNFPSYQWGNVHTNDKFITINPNVTMSGAWGALSADYEVGKQHCDILQGATLEITIANATGGNVTFVNAPFLFQSIDVIANGGETIHTIQPEHLWLNWLWENAEAYALVQPTLNQGATFGAGSVLADGASITYRVPFREAFFAMPARGVELFALNDSLRFRVTLATASNALTSGSTATISSVILRVHGKNLTPADKARLSKVYDTTPVQYKVLLPQNYVINSGSETATVEYTRQLNGIAGLISHMVILQRSSTLSAGGLQVPIALTQYDILKPDGQSAIGAPLPTAYARGVYALSYLPSTLVVNLAVYLATASNDPVSAVKNGIVSGFWDMKNDWSIRYTSSDTASHQMTIVYYAWHVLTFAQGKIFKSKA